MPQRDPLEELFRQNESKLDQRPSLRTWRRLEDRLDGRDGLRRTQGPFKPWMYAAAAVLLICVTIFGFGANALNPSNNLAQRPEVIEDLELVAESPQRATPYEGIAEGDPHQILQVRNPEMPTLLPAPKYRL